jgi:hypothetical protein
MTTDIIKQRIINELIAGVITPRKAVNWAYAVGLYDNMENIKDQTVDIVKWLNRPNIEVIKCKKLAIKRAKRGKYKKRLTLK